MSVPTFPSFHQKVYTMHGRLHVRSYVSLRHVTNNHNYHLWTTQRTDTTSVSPSVQTHPTHTTTTGTIDVIVQPHETGATMIAEVDHPTGDRTTGPIVGPLHVTTPGLHPPTGEIQGAGHGQMATDIANAAPQGTMQEKLTARCVMITTNRVSTQLFNVINVRIMVTYKLNVRPL